MALSSSMWMLPFVPASGTYVIRFALNGTYQNLTFPATGSFTTGQNYWWKGDYTSDDLCLKLTETLDTHTSTGSHGTFTVSLGVNPNGMPSIVINKTDVGGATTFGFDPTASTTLNLNNIGVSNTAITTTTSGDLVFYSECPRGWFVPGYPFSVDTRNLPRMRGGLAETLDGSVYMNTVSAVSDRRSIGWQYVPRSVALAEYSSEVDTYHSFCKAFDWHWQNYVGMGGTIRVVDDPADSMTTQPEYKVVDHRPPIERCGDAPVLYNLGPIQLRSV